MTFAPEHMGLQPPGLYMAMGLTIILTLQPLPWCTVWRVIFVGTNFRGKSEKALKINFYGFKIRDSNQSRGMALLHKQ